jgi:hypothetical protein
VLDYLWGPSAEVVLDSDFPKGPGARPSRVRFIQVGQSAGKAVSLAAATLRSSAVELSWKRFNVLA